MSFFGISSRLLTTTGVVSVYSTYQINSVTAESPIDIEHDKPSSQLLHRCRRSCKAMMCKKALPGLFISVHKDGRLVWEEGMGFSDVENRLRSSPKSVIRIASISKSLTAVLVGKFIDDGKLSLEDSVSDYLPNYPFPNISVKQLLSHTSGIRHYEKKNASEMKPEPKEFHLNKRFNSVSESLELFKNDELLHEPGSKYSYTTHGFTLLSAIIEEAERKHRKKLDPTNTKTDKIRFDNLMKRMFKDLGLQNTYLDEHEPIIYNRARYYVRDKDHILKNSPHVDNSYKWAGGGFLSTVGDLTRFGDVVLYSYQNKDGYLSRATTKKLWSGVVKTYPEASTNEYALGWCITPEKEVCKMCRRDAFTVDHTGAAIGASSVLLIRPGSNKTDDEGVKGVVVAIITNMEGISLKELAKEIAEEFYKEGITKG